MKPLASSFAGENGDIVLARAVRARPRGPWRPCWGRIAALGFSLGFWSLVGWAVVALLGRAS